MDHRTRYSISWGFAQKMDLQFNFLGIFRKKRVKKQNISLEKSYANRRRALASLYSNDKPGKKRILASNAVFSKLILEIIQASISKLTNK